MLGRLYDDFVRHYLRDKRYERAEKEFNDEATIPPPPIIVKKTKAPLKIPKEITGYEKLKYITGGRLYTGDLPEHFPNTFSQFKEYIEQSLEDYKVL